MAKNDSISMESKDLDAMLDAYSQLQDVTIPDLTRKHARLLAVELANRTQPFSVGKGGGAKGKERGTKRTRFDIERLFNGEQMFRDIIDGTENKRLATKFRKMQSAGQWQELAALMRTIGIIKKPLKVVSSSMLAHHKNRNKISGRVYSNRRIDAIYISQDSDEYINEMVKRVGFSKAGWAACARLIKGIKGDPARGIPAWAKKKAHGNWARVVDRTNNTENPRIYLKNRIRWISRICPESEQKKALRIVHEKMLKSIKIAMAHARKAKSTS
tara:strand:- start:2103 stop:2918 length:816 start_codon:yes stop_codon:yes gene_type:complete